MKHYQTKKEINQDTKKAIYHIYKNGRFYLTCENQRQLKKVLAILESN